MDKEAPSGRSMSQSWWNFFVRSFYTITSRAEQAAAAPSLEG